MRCLYLEEGYFRRNSWNRSGLEEEDMTSLSVVSYIERINRMYRLIRKESTGSRAELAGRMRVSERTVSNYLEELR